MRILILLPDLRGGGAERLHVYLAKHWHANGIQVEFALMNRCGDLLELLPEHIGIVDLGAKRIRQVILPLARYLRKERPDITIAAMWPLTSAAVLAWRLAGKPGRLYLSDHNQLSVSCVHELNISPYFISASMRLTYTLASGLIAVSEGVKKDMCRLGAFPESRVRVIYNPTAIGISPHRESVLVREGLWGAGFDYHILSIGTLKAQKDHATLIKAFARLPLNLNVKLTILGEGPLRSELEDLVVELGLQDRVALPGFVVDPYPWIRSADLFVLSSRWEGFGNVIVEALECGVPVVSTDCPSGPAEILENGRYGQLVSVNDPEAMAVAISASLAKSHDREALMNRAKAFSVSNISDQYIEYFRQGENCMIVNQMRGCPLCGAHATGTTFPYTTKFNNIRFSYLKCDGCSNVFVDPVPDSQTFARMYAKADYHDCHYESNEGGEYTASAQLLKQYLPAGASVLDYGCGVGAFLKALKVEGFVPYGVEFDRDAAQYAGKNAGCLTMSVSDFLALQDKPMFDAIHLGDVLEHLPDPASTLKDLLGYVKPNGMLFVEGPLEINPSPVYWAARFFGYMKRIVKPGYIASHAPTHLFRTDARQQFAFFYHVTPNLDLKYWQIYETGWPYVGGGAIKRAIAKIAIRLSGKQFMGLTFGNRFRGIFACENSLGGMVQSVANPSEKKI